MYIIQVSQAQLDGCGLWVVGYGLWVVGYGLWVINRKPKTKNLKPFKFSELKTCET